MNVDDLDRSFRRQVFLGAGVVVGLVSAGIGWMIVREQRVIRETWIKVEARVDSVEYRSRGRGANTAYLPVVAYTLVRDGHDYHGYLELKEVGELQEVFNVLNRFPVDQPVELLIHPDDPRRTLLPDGDELAERGRSYLGFGLVLAFFCAVFLNKNAASALGS